MNMNYDRIFETIFEPGENFDLIKKEVLILLLFLLQH